MKTEPNSFGSIFAAHGGKQRADQQLAEATGRANAIAARLLAARECPPDLIEWGRIHGIPTFAEVTWQAGFLAGMRAASLKETGHE
jgi:hypothetical protein